MAEKKYSLTKQESDRLGNLLSVIKIQQEILDSITESYRNYVIGEVFKRVGVSPDLYENSAVNLGAGELIISEPEKLPEQPKKVEATGKT